MRGTASPAAPSLAGNPPWPLHKEWAETLRAGIHPCISHRCPLGQACRGSEGREQLKRPGTRGAWPRCEGPGQQNTPPPQAGREGSRAIARRNLQAHHGAWKPWWGHNTGRILLGRDKRIPRFSPPPGDRELGGAWRNMTEVPRSTSLQGSCPVPFTLPSKLWDRIGGRGVTGRVGVLGPGHRFHSSRHQASG